MASLCDAAHTLIGALFPHAVDIYKQPEKVFRYLIFFINFMQL